MGELPRAGRPGGHRQLRFQSVVPPPDAAYRLTPQETRLLELLAQGHGYQEAGDALGITGNAVRNHIRSIYEKLEVHSSRRRWPKRSAPACC